MISWRNFDRWARRRGFTFVRRGNNDEYITGFKGKKSFRTGRHNSPHGVPDGLLEDIAHYLGITKRNLEEDIRG